MTFTDINSAIDVADPWVVLWRQNYYYCAVKSNKIWISQSKTLQDIGKTPEAVWAPPKATAYSENLWAPELHYLDSKWYIYFAADDGCNKNHRMYVLEGNSDYPQGSYTFKGKIAASTDKWAIDGTVMVLDDGSKYFIWSGWEGDEDGQQNIYIAPMSNPWTISGERVCISIPKRKWEKGGQLYVNEGPQVLKKNGKIHIIYSAGFSQTPDYCLGRLTYIGNEVLKRESWIKQDTPVFCKTPDVFGPGHACFVQSPDATQDWIVYHAKRTKDVRWDRYIRAQKFVWNADSSPDFGVPMPVGVSIESYAILPTRVEG